MIKGGNTTIYVSDMDRAVEFYTKTLGLKLRFRQGGHFAQIDGGPGLSLALHPAGPESPRPGHSGSIMVGFSVTDSIEKEVETLRKRGVHFRGPIKDSDPVKLAFFGDPDGNDLYLCEYCKRDTLGKKIRSALFYLVYLISFVLVVIYLFFWRPFVNELRETRKPKSNEIATSKHVDSTIIKRLGHLRAKKRSSFVHFSQEDEGAIRVCAFGDSFTYGYEVDESHDYPSILQNLLSRRGIENVEVINFGSSAHGFHQAYMMWDSVGRNFACDYILLGPSCFQERRDTTFNHTDLDSPYYLHSRYVLEDGDVRRVDVLGDTHEERFDHYFRFIPHLRYLRYDRNPPADLSVDDSRGSYDREPLLLSRWNPVRRGSQDVRGTADQAGRDRRRNRSGPYERRDRGHRKTDRSEESRRRQDVPRGGIPLRGAQRPQQRHGK